MVKEKNKIPCFLDELIENFICKNDLRKSKGEAFVVALLAIQEVTTYDKLTLLFATQKKDK